MSTPARARSPELADVWWRRPMDERRADRGAGRISTAYTAVYVTPFIVIGVALLLLEPLLFPVAMWSFAHAWVIPELFAHRGARVAFPLEALRRARARSAPRSGLLGDLLDHEPRELMADTGPGAATQGRLGAWLVGEAGALLVRPNGWRVHCFCVRATDPELPRGDRIAHLLLALRAGRDRLRDGREPRLHRRGVAGPPAAARASAAGAGRGDRGRRVLASRLAARPPPPPPRRRRAAPSSCPLLVGGQVDDGRGQAGKLAAVQHQIRAAVIQPARPRAGADRASPDRLALVWRTPCARRPGGASAPSSSGTRTPTLFPRRQGRSARPGSGTITVTGPGRSRASARVSAGPAPRGRPARPRARRTSPPRACPARGP